MCDAETFFMINEAGFASSRVVSVRDIGPPPPLCAQTGPAITGVELGGIFGPGQIIGIEDRRRQFTSYVLEAGGTGSEIMAGAEIRLDAWSLTSEALCLTHQSGARICLSFSRCLSGEAPFVATRDGEQTGLVLEIVNMGGHAVVDEPPVAEPTRVETPEPAPTPPAGPRLWSFFGTDDPMKRAQDACRKWSSLRCGAIFLPGEEDPDARSMLPDDIIAAGGQVPLRRYLSAQRIEGDKLSEVMALNGWTEADLDVIVDMTEINMFAHGGFHPRDFADQTIAYSFAEPLCEAQIARAVDNGARCGLMSELVARFGHYTIEGFLWGHGEDAVETFIAQNDLPAGTTGDTELVLNRWYLISR